MMSDILLIVTKLVLFLSAIISFWRWKELKLGNLIYFPFYMLFVVLIEVCSHFNGISSIDKLLYTLFDIVTYLFFISWFYKILSKNKLVVLLGICYVISLIFSLILEDITGELKIQSTVGTMIMFLLSILFYTSLIKSNQLIDFIRLPAFWIVTGILIFTLGYLPITFSLTRDFLPSRNVVYLILVVVNVLLYGFFSIAFLCPQKR